MSTGKRYAEEFEAGAVEQVTVLGYALAEVAARLGVSAWSLHRWITERSQPPGERSRPWKRRRRSGA